MYMNMYLYVYKTRDMYTRMCTTCVYFVAGSSVKRDAHIPTDPMTYMCVYTCIINVCMQTLYIYMCMYMHMTQTECLAQPAELPRWLSW